MSGLFFVCLTFFLSYKNTFVQAFSRQEEVERQSRVERGKANVGFLGCWWLYFFLLVAEERWSQLQIVAAAAVCWCKMVTLLEEHTSLFCEACGAIGIVCVH